MLKKTHKTQPKKQYHKDLELLKEITWGTKVGKVFQAHFLWPYRLVTGNISFHLDIWEYVQEVQKTSGKEVKGV